MSATPVKFLDLARENKQYEPELSEAAARVVASGYYIMGPELDTFEAEFASFCGTKFAVGVANGLDALEIALRAWNIGPGDEVIVPSNTYIATWLAVDAVGARCVPVEPSPNTYLIEADAIRAALTSNTKAVIGVHLYGRSMDFRPIRTLCDEVGIKFLEDGAQAHGAAVDGIRVGAQGHAAAFSFYPGKNLGALGDAGAITTDDPETAEAARVIRNYGSRVKYVNDRRGKNSRLDPIQAALLSVKLPKLDAANAKRRALAELYVELLDGIDGVQLPQVPDDGLEHVWHLFVIRVSDRDGLIKHLDANGIQTLIHYPIPPHEQEAYADYEFAKSAFPIASQIHDEILSLPLSSTHTEEEIKAVADAVRGYFEQ